MDKLGEKLVEIMAKLEGLAATHGSAAVDLALNVARVSAAADIAIGIGFALSVFACARLCAFLSAKHQVWQAAPDRREWDDSPWLFFLVFAAIGGGALAIVSAIYLFNLWNWVGLIYPELYLAHRLVGL
jgi:hypothetical protein